MYDWANSAFATTVMAGFFPIFFCEYWSVDVPGELSETRWALANSVAGITIAILAPILGAIADRGRSRKRFLAFFAYLGVVMTASLYMVSQGNWLVALVLYVVATFGFSGGNIFYDALITAVASEKRMDLVSALGFSMGYLGGGILFAINVWMVLRPSTFGFADAGGAIRFSFLAVAVWWAVFSLPLFLFVTEPRGVERTGGVNMVRAGFAQLRETFREIRHLKTIFLFLLAYWLYIDGVDTIVRMAVIYGKTIGIGNSTLISALLITQFVGFPAALGFGWLGARIGTKRAIFIAIAVYLFVSVWGAFLRSANEFYVLAILVGLVQGGIQSLSRAYYARIIPVDKSAQYFGFYNMIGKFAVVIGPVLMAGAILVMRSMGYSGLVASRASITAISILFIAGGVLLYFVNEEKGKEQVKYLSGKR